MYSSDKDSARESSGIIKGSGARVVFISKILGLG